MQTHNQLKVTSCIRMTSKKETFNKVNTFYFILSKCCPSIKCAQKCADFEVRLSGHPCYISFTGEMKIRKKKLVELAERGSYNGAQMSR
jgi:hypothetical protein